MPRPKPNIEKIRVDLRIRQDQHKRLLEMSREDDETSMSAFVRRALDLYFEQIDAREKKSSVKSGKK